MAVFKPISHVVFIPESGTQFEITKSINHLPCFHYTILDNLTISLWFVHMIDIECIVDKFKTPKWAQVISGISIC